MKVNVIPFFINWISCDIMLYRLGNWLSFTSTIFSLWYLEKCSEEDKPDGTFHNLRVAKPDDRWFLAGAERSRSPFVECSVGIAKSSMQHRLVWEISRLGARGRRPEIISANFPMTNWNRTSSLPSKRTLSMGCKLFQFCFWETPGFVIIDEGRSTFIKFSEIVTCRDFNSIGREISRDANNWRYRIPTRLLPKNEFIEKPAGLGKESFRVKNRKLPPVSLKSAH